MGIKGEGKLLFWRENGYFNWDDSQDKEKLAEHRIRMMSVLVLHVGRKFVKQLKLGNQ